MSCECIQWAQAGNPHGLHTEHHHNCPKYDPVGEAKKHLENILKAFCEYCNEGDGVPSEYWDDYKRALLFVGQIERWKRAMECEDL